MENAFEIVEYKYEARSNTYIIHLGGRALKKICVGDVLFAYNNDNGYVVTEITLYLTKVEEVSPQMGCYITIEGNTLLNENSGKEPWNRNENHLFLS